MSIWRNLFRKQQVERDLHDETSSFLELLAQEKIRSGLDLAEARRQARLEMGGAEQVRELVRDARSGAFLDALWQDTRYGARVLRKNPGFTLAAALVLALGIGANSAMFSLVYGVLLRPLPYPGADRAAGIYMHFSPQNAEHGTLSAADYFDWKARNRAFSEIALCGGRRFDLSGNEGSEQVIGGGATANFFSILGSAPIAGRTFAATDDAANSPGVVVLSERLWQRRYHGDRALLGKSILLDHNAYTVIGVMPDAFRFPRTESELWVNFRLAPPTRRGPFSFYGLGRLRPGVTMAQAQSEMNAIAGGIEQANPSTYSHLTMPVVPLRDVVIGSAGPSIQIMFGAVVFVLVIACVNVASLLLARAGAREHEMAIRLSLGAGRRRLLQQLLTESLLLSILGGAAGIAIAAWGVQALRVWNPGHLPRMEDVRLDGGVLAFTAIVAVLSGITAGLAPALEAWRGGVNTSLKENSRGNSSGASRRRVLASLVVVETALSLVLLTGAGLLVKSFVLLQHVDLGIQTPADHILTMRVSPDARAHTANGALTEFYRRVIERVRAVPGVRHAAIATGLPPNRNGNQDSFVIEGQTFAPGEGNPVVEDVYVTPDYFRALGIPLRQGRFFTEADNAKAPLVMIISESMARRYFPGGSPLGRRIKESGPGLPNVPYCQVVGVVGDTRYEGMDQTPEAFYLPLDQNGFGPRQNLVVSTAMPAASLAATLERAVTGAEPETVTTQVMTLDQATSDSVDQPRFRAALVGGFAMVALLLAAVGIYGVIAYSVSQRTHEIGVRMALGAGRRHILRMVVREGALLTGAGVALGAAGALALTRLLVGLLFGLLFGVSPTDPLTLAAVALLLASVAFAAIVIPARRATKLNPLVALRSE